MMRGTGELSSGSLRRRVGPGRGTLSQRVGVGQGTLSQQRGGWGRGQCGSPDHREGPAENLQNLVARRRRPRAAQLLVYETDQELHPEQRRDHHVTSSRDRVTRAGRHHRDDPSPTPGSRLPAAGPGTVQAPAPWSLPHMQRTPGPNVTASSPPPPPPPGTASRRPGPRGRTAAKSYGSRRRGRRMFPWNHGKKCLK